MTTLRTHFEIRNAARGKHRVVTSSGSCGFEKRTGARDTGSYYVRLSIGGKEIVMGLGRFGEIGAVEACGAAAAERAKARKGIDPIAERDRQKAANLAEEKKSVTCRKAAETFFEMNKDAWRGRYYAQQWWSQMTRFAFPIIGDMPIGDLLPEHIAAIRRATNAVGAPTVGEQVQKRLGAVVDMSVARGWCSALQRNPAGRNLVGAYLPATRKRGEPNHFARVPLKDAPAAFSALLVAEKRAQGAVQSSLAAWAVMASCALRPAEARNMPWSEVFLDERRVMISAERTKCARAHIVPISSLAFALLERQAARRVSDFVFPGRGGTPPGHVTFTLAAKAVGVNLATAHGWRSVFADWCGEIAHVDSALAEAALAHTLGRTQAAYKRETGVEARRPVMEKYAGWLIGIAEDNVLAFPKRA
jgi:integrase